MAYKLQIETNNPILVAPLECPVCLKDMWTQVTLSCGHQYHFRCINTWFGYQKNCPYCRHPFSPPASPVGRPPPPPPPPPVQPPSVGIGPTFSDASETYEEIRLSTQCIGCFSWVRQLRRRHHQLQSVS